MRTHTGTRYGDRATDTETDTVKVLSTEFFNDVRNAIVAGGTGRGSCFEGTGCDIKIIMDNNDIFWGELIEMDELTDRCTRSVHKRFWLDEENFLLMDHSFTHLSGHFFIKMKVATMKLLLKKIETQKSSIMTCEEMIVSWITESNNEFHRM